MEIIKSVYLALQREHCLCSISNSDIGKPQQGHRRTLLRRTLSDFARFLSPANTRPTITGAAAIMGKRILGSNLTPHFTKISKTT